MITPAVVRDPLRYSANTHAEIFEFLESSPNGLTTREAEFRIEMIGENKLPEQKPDSIFTIFFRQFQSPLIYILLVASIAIFFIGERVDSAIILFVLLFNSITGAIQEGKAQNTLRALQTFVKTNSTVLRDGTEVILPDTAVVPGDIITLNEGEKIPADARLVISHSLMIDEAALTGESSPVHKITEPLRAPAENATDARNMVFRGTYITSGNGIAVVTATGIDTVIGGISQKITSIDTDIPLKASIGKLSKFVLWIIAGLSVVLFAMNLSSGATFKETFIIVVSVVVSIIPEGLPIVMTLVLAMGVWRMNLRKALVKKLHAVEGLGHAKIIAVDKTGTLTKNEMVIRKIYADGEIFYVQGIGYEPKGAITQGGKKVSVTTNTILQKVGKIAALCANAQVAFMEKEKIWRVGGDPTEAAMLVLGEKLGYKREELEREMPLLHEVPFDYKTRFHLVAHQVKQKQFVTIAGAPEQVLARCTKYSENNRFIKLTETKREALESIFHKMSSEGLRVVAFGVAELSLAETEFYAASANATFSFVGFFGMEDALRLEVRDAVLRAQTAGIRVVMITGDHSITAGAIARAAGITDRDDEIITGVAIDNLSDEELARALEKIRVFARVTPEHKLRIIQAYRSRGEVVAMTGDGVNDALSLVAADLGVAMGKIGTEVAKEAADIILLDDNFGTILSAVEEGRNIYHSMKKVILYLFSSGLGEALTVIGALVLGYPLPLLASQIIWLNFVTNGFLDIGLAMDQKEKHLLTSKFARTSKYLIDKFMGWRMATMALPMAVGTLALFSVYANVDLEKAWTMSLTSLAVFQWFNVWNCRSDRNSIFGSNIFSNIFLLGAMSIVIALQILAIYTPFLQRILHTVPLSIAEWGIIIAIALSIVVIEEVRKFVYRRTLRKEVAINA